MADVTEGKELGSDLYLETDVDKLYELIKEKGLIKVKKAAKKFRVKEEQIEEWGRILEEHDLAALHYPPIGEPVLILKKFKPKAEIKHGKRKLKHRKALFINITIIVVFVLFVLFYTGRLGSFSIPDLSDLSRLPDVLLQNQIYLLVILIIIIAFLLIITLRKASKKKKGGGKHASKGKGKKL